MNFETLAVDSGENVYQITLNRPDSLNALSIRLLTELRQALETARDDEDCRAILLDANGRAFSSGADLKEAAANPQLTSYEALVRYYNPVMQLMHEMPKPVIAAVQGIAAGAGCNLALNADIVIAGRSAVFQQIFTNIALVPDAGGSWLLPRLMGSAKAAGAVLSGEAIDATRAEAWGMIWEVVEDDALAEHALAFAYRMSQRPTRALGLAKRLLQDANSNDFATQLLLEAETQQAAQQSADASEAVRAFIEKRKPKFTGR